MTFEEMISVIRAAQSGAKIQCKVRDPGALFLVRQTACKCKANHAEWSTPCNNPPAFSFGLFDYRVLPGDGRASWSDPRSALSKGSFIPPPNALPYPPRVDELGVKKSPVPGPTECPPSGIRPTGGKTEAFRFNELHVSRLAVKVDGHTEHVFIAIINGSAVGQVIANRVDYGSTIRGPKVSHIRKLYIMPVHRHKGVATRLMRDVEAWAKTEHATQLELCVLKGNAAGRAFWIKRCKFINIDGRDAPEGPRQAEYVVMEKSL